MREDLADILFSEEIIDRRVRELGAQISRDYAGRTPLLVGVLKGSFVFMADLIRSISIPCCSEFLAASSYGDGSVTTGCVEIKKCLSTDVAGRDVIIVEDILDSGVTLSHLKEYFAAMHPASVKICVFLDKVSRRTVPVDAEYVGFECPDAFVVGYGLDYAERYRNLPYIGSLKPEIYS